ncbi:hypothetical protein DRQ33_07280, partial [bacterium]
TAFFACEQGFYRSVELDSIEKITIVDDETGMSLPLDQMISSALAGETLWVGSDFGLAYTLDGCGCESFKILFHRPDVAENNTYAFPSPFSPSQHGEIFFVFDNPLSGEVKLEIFDFAIDNVFTMTENVNKGDKAMIQWDGVDNNGEYPANGIYFYRITLPDGEKLWGKFALLR